MPRKTTHCRAGFLPVDVLIVRHANHRGEISTALTHFATVLGKPVVGLSISPSVARYHGLEMDTCLLLQGAQHRAVWSNSRDFAKIETLARELSASFAGGFYAVRDLRKSPPQAETKIEMEGSL